MTQTSWPFANQDTSETQFSKWATMFHDGGVDGDPTGTQLKVTGDSSGMQVKMAAGFALNRGFAYDSDAVVTIAIGAASASPRRDLVVLRLDPTTDSIVPFVVVGTPNAVPVDPSLTNTATGINDILLARVNVAASTTTISAGIVDDIRKFCDAPMGRHTTVNRPTSARIGKLAFNFTTGKYEQWDGTNWVNVVRDAADLTTGTLTRPSSGDHTGLINGKKISVQQVTPSSPAVGDALISW